MTDRDRFDKFTERARKVLSLAQEEAQRFQHNYIGTEHLLLGLVREGEGVAARVLLNLGVTLEQVRSAVEFIIARGDRIVLGEIGLTPRAKKIIELAVDEARRLNHHYIGTEHLLLGLVREGQGIAAGVLESLGVTLERVRIETMRTLGEPVSEAQMTTAIEQDLGRPYHAPMRLSEATHFSEGARKAIQFAIEEARLLQHDSIGPQYLLLGLVREEEGIAGKVLESFAIDLARARSAVEKLFPRGGDTASTPIGFTSLARAYMLLAADEADRMKQEQIGTEHLLLGLLREERGIIPDLLAELGTNVEAVRTKTLEAIKQQ